MNNIAAILLQKQGSQWPDKVALRCQGRSVTYQELKEKACAMADLLLSRGIKPGERVMLVMGDCISAFTVFLGCAWAGIVAVLVSDRLLVTDYASYIGDCRPTLLLTIPGHAALAAAEQTGVEALLLDDQRLDELLCGQSIDRAFHAVSGAEGCVVFYTSGTTGRPKGVPHSHGHCLAVAQYTGQHYMGYRQEDIVLASPKIFHAYGLLSSLLNPLFAGARSILDPFKPTPMTTLAMIESEKVSIYASSPSFYCMLLMQLDNPQAIHSLRLCQSAGEALPEAVFNAWKEKTGLEIWQGFGTSEAMTMVLGNRSPDIIPGTAGLPLPGYEIAILNEENQPVLEGSPGQLAVKGPTLMHGYLNAPDLTAAVFSQDGWLLTGDLARVENGVYVVMGRKDDMFKCGGQWVSPTRVENVLLSHVAVAQCAVTGGMVGPYTLVRAHVVLKPDYIAHQGIRAELLEHGRQNLPDHMAPADIAFYDSLPMTAIGKIQRYLLRQVVGSADSGTKKTNIIN